MLFVGLFSWWYGAGWLQLARRAMGRVLSMADFFSIGLLLKTLLAPYRQISVSQVNGPLGVKLRAWADLQISRVIGAMIRLIVILFGLAATLLMLVVALALMVIWPFVPVLPVVAGLIAFGGAS